MTKYKTYVVTLVTAIALIMTVFGQKVAEYNSGNNWVHPGAKKQVGMDFINTSTGKMVNNGRISFRGNFINDGSFGYNTSHKLTPGLTLFEGTASQTISGSGTTRFYSVMFNHKVARATIQLKQPIEVASRLDLTNGIVKASQSSVSDMSNRVLIDAGAVCVNASDKSFVDGFVEKEGNSAFEFPVGNGQYFRPASIDAPLVATDRFAVRYVAGNPSDNGYSVDKHITAVGVVSRKEYWIVNRTQGTSTPSLTLTWDVNKVSDAIPSDISKVMIARWDGSKWINESTLSTTGNEKVGSVTSSVSGYGVFTLATQGSMVLQAVDDKYTMPQAGVLTASVANNDQVSSGMNNSWTITDNAVNGSVTMQRNGTFTYVPAGSVVGNDSFSYTITDAYGATTTAKVAITIEPINGYMLFTKQATVPLLQGDAGYVWKYIFTVTNKHTQPANVLQITDDLQKIFTNPMSFQVIDIRATGNLQVNSLYDGSAQKNALLSTSFVNPGATDTLEISVKVMPNGFKGIVSNQALLGCQYTTLGTSLALWSDDSTNSTDVAPRPTLTNVKEIDIMIPQIFTPNGDGVNDNFIIVHKKDVVIALEVYSRWGSLVYKSDDYQNDWEGYADGFKSTGLPAGTYFYKVIKTYIETGEKEQYSGFTTIKR